MTLSPLRFAAVHQFTNPTLGQLGAFEHNLDKFVWSPDKDQLTVLTEEDADTAQMAYDYFKAYPDPALAPKDRSPEVREARKWLKLTGVQSEEALNDWYLNTPLATIEDTHQKFQDWARRFEGKLFGSSDPFQFGFPTVRESIRYAQFQLRLDSPHPNRLAPPTGKPNEFFDWLRLLLNKSDSEKSPKTP